MSSAASARPVGGHARDGGKGTSLPSPRGRSGVGSAGSGRRPIFLWSFALPEDPRTAWSVSGGGLEKPETFM